MALSVSEKSWGRSEKMSSTLIESNWSVGIGEESRDGVYHLGQIRIFSYSLSSLKISKNPFKFLELKKRLY